MLISHVQAVGPFLRVFGQLDLERMVEIQTSIEHSIVASQHSSSVIPKINDLPIETICLALFNGTQYRRARVIGHRGHNEVFVQFIDYGNECNVKIHEVRLLNFQNSDVKLLQTIPTQASPFILSRIYCEWSQTQINELNADLTGNIVNAVTEAEVGGFKFITIIWRNETLVNYLVYIKQFGNFITLKEQTNTFYDIMTKSRGLVPVRQLHATVPNAIVGNTVSIVQTAPLPLQSPLASAGLVRPPQVYRMPYRHSNVLASNSRNGPTMPTTALPNQQQGSPPKRSVMTFKSNTLMVGNYYDVYCCFVENGPCLFSIHLTSSTDDLNQMMAELEQLPLRNLTERPSIGMACIARYSEDNQLYRAVIMTIKPTACQVAYVDYGNTEFVSFVDLYEIPPNLLDQRIFAIRFALSNYKELEPLDDSLKAAFKEMVLHQDLLLKVMPLEGPPLVQYCELYLKEVNVLEALKAYKTRQLFYSTPPAINNNDTVVIRYVESPKRFFIQKVDSIPSFDQMMDDLFLYCKKRKTTLKNHNQGAACAVKFENAWYRAEIIGTNADNKRVHIRHVDFGNERNVDLEQLCAISEELVQQPIQAIQCCLKGFEHAETLSESATVQLEMLAENADNERRHFKCQIYEIRDNGTYLVNLIDEKMRPELNLMKKLYKLSMPFNKYIGLEKEEYPYTNSAPLKPVPTHDDYISHPSILNSTPSNQDEPTNNLSIDWEAKSSNSADSRDRHSPSDNYRNKRSPQQQQQQQQQHHSSQQQQQQHSPRSFKDNNSRWEQKEPPNTTFKGGQLPPRFQKQQEENRKFRENRELYEPPKRYNDRPRADTQPAQTAATDDWEDSPAVVSKPAYTPAPPIASSNSEQYVSSDFVYKYNDVLVPSRDEVLLCWWVSPHQFYTHSCSAVAKFENLMRQIQLFYKSKSPVPSSFRIESGLNIIARFPKDKVLYRATILACNETLRKYRVEFVDFGNQATVTANDIWQLESRFSEHPVMSQLCSFENVVSNFDHRQITNNVEKYLVPDLKLYCNYVKKENNLYYADIDVKGQSLRQLLIEDGSISEVAPNLSLEMLSGQQIRINIVSVRDLLNFQIQIEGCDLKLLCSYNDIKFVKSNSHLSNEFKKNYEGKACVADVIDVSKEKILMLQPIIALFTNDVSQKICNYPVVYREFNVKIAYIETEHIIYAHPLIIEEKLGTMLDAMYNFYSEQGTPQSSFTPGTLCAALSSDSNWYRARILSSDSTTIEVYFIDYGNVELIETFDNIKELDEQFFDCSALAIRFYFPIKSKKTDDESTSIETIRTLTDGYELTLSIVDRYQNCWIADIQSNGQTLINVLRDSYSITDGMDIEYAKNVIDNDATRHMIAQSPSTASQTQSFDLEPPKMSTSSVELAASDSGILMSEKSDDIPSTMDNNMIASYLSHCDNPSRFFVHLAATFSDLQKLQDNIQIVAGSLPPLMTAVTGALCIALYTVDETWYRARIIDSEIMAVQFIDYGNTDVVTDSAYVKEMNDAFADIPPFAIPCALAISPRNTTDWVDEANQIFNDAYDKTIYISYITQNPKKNYVNLKIDSQNVAEHLIAKGLARKLEVLRSGDSGFVSHINNLSDFYIQMESYADGLELIAGHLSDFENFKILTKCTVGDVCAAIFPEDSSWYRAKILSHSSDGTEVLFIDYGNAAITTELREISTEIANLPFLSKKCSLRMPDHILGWSDAAEAKLHELSAMGETVFVVELIEPSDHAIVDLYINGRNILEDLEPLCDKRPNIDLDLSSSMGGEELQAQLHDSKQLDVIVSHTNTPIDFYVQLHSEKDELDLVLDELNSENEMPPVEKLEVGMNCVAMFDDDGAFYRAKILSIGDELGTEVLFIDYGNKAYSKDLRVMPEKWIAKRGLAYHCSLDSNVLPELTTSDSIGNKFVQFIVDHQEELCKIEILDRNVEPWIVTLLCDGYNMLEELEKEIAGDSSIFKDIVDTIVEKSIVDATEQSEAVDTLVITLVEDSLKTDEEIVDEVLSVAVNEKLETIARKEVGEQTIARDVVNDIIKDTLTIDNEIAEQAIDSAINSSLDKIAEHIENTTMAREVVEKAIEESLDRDMLTAGDAVNDIINDTLTTDNEIAEQAIDSAINTSLDRIAEHIENTTMAREVLEKAIEESLDKDMLTAGISVKVKITQVNSALDFYIRCDSTETEFNELNESLKEASNFPELENAHTGLVCAAFVQTKNCYHRAKIISKCDDNSFDVELIDSGERETVKDLRTLPDNLRFKSAFVKHCAIKTAQPISGATFKMLIEQNIDNVFQIAIIDRSNDPWIVDLQTDKIDIQRELAAMNMTNEAIDASLQEILKDAVVSHTNSPNDFYIQLTCDTKNLEKITELLYDAVNFAKIETPEMGQLCAAVFPDDGAFYRAELLSINASSYEVLFVDFGNSSSTEDIRELPKDLAIMDPIAKQCALENKSEIDFWSELACDLFTTLVTSHLGETFQVEIQSTDQRPWIVKLFREQIDLYDELKRMIVEQQMQSQNSSDVWEEAKDSSGAIVACEIVDELVDTSLQINGNGVAEKSCSLAAGSSSVSQDDSLHSFPDDDIALGKQLWDGLHKLGITDLQSIKSQSTSNLCDKNDGKKSTSCSLGIEKNDQTRSKSVECIADKN